MTHNDIYTKFMIEYDKANVTSSYPSLTKYEAATLLDRAYLALISRKLTGNNTRRVPFEYDTKAIEDLRPLVFTKRFKQEGKSRTVSNEYKFAMPDDLMYYIEGVANYGSEREIVLPVNHQIARKFKLTNSNIPWVNHPVSYIEGSEVYVLIDPFLHTSSPDLDGTYIKMPASFVKSLKEIEDELNENPPGGDDNGGDNNGDNNGGGSDNNGGNNSGGGDTPGGNDDPGNDDNGNDNPIIVQPPAIYPQKDTFDERCTITIVATLADHILYRIDEAEWHEYNEETEIIITETSTILAYAVVIDKDGSHVSDTTTKTYTKRQLEQSQDQTFDYSSQLLVNENENFIIDALGGKIGMSWNYRTFYNEPYVVLHIYLKNTPSLKYVIYRRASLNQLWNEEDQDIIDDSYEAFSTINGSSGWIDLGYRLSRETNNYDVYFELYKQNNESTAIFKSKYVTVPKKENSSNTPEAPDPFAYASEAVLDEELTSNVLGEATLGEIILQ